MNSLADQNQTSQPQDQDDDNADFFERNLLYQMMGVIGWIILTMSIIVLAWVSEPCITRVSSRWKQPPRCVLETGNVNTLLQRLASSSKSKSKKDGETQHGIVLPDSSRQRLIDLELATKHAADTRSPLTPLLFHGPSGTGKRSAAKQLAQSLALPYALVSGKALASSSHIDALISWANSFSEGNAVLIFVDEADVFLSNDRSLSKYLAVLDGVRRDIFFILAARDVENIDQAVIDRCEQLQFALPDAECRRELLLKYFDEHVSLINTNDERESSLLFSLIRTFATKDQRQRMQSIDSGVMSGESLENAVALTRGLSGRDIHELMLALKTKLRRSKHGQVTYLDVWEKIEEAQMKQRSSSAGTAEHSISMTNLQNEVDFHEVTVV